MEINGRWTRFDPAPGRSTTGAMSSAWSSATGPMPERSRIMGLAYVPAASTTRSASMKVQSKRRIPVALVPEHSTCAATVSGRMVRFARDRARSSSASAV